MNCLVINLADLDLHFHGKLERTLLLFNKQMVPTSCQAQYKGQLSMAGALRAVTDSLGGSVDMEGLEHSKLSGRQGWIQGQLDAIFFRREGIYYHHVHQPRTQGVDHEFCLHICWRIKNSRNACAPSSSFFQGLPASIQINFLLYLASFSFASGFHFPQPLCFSLCFMALPYIESDS